MPSSPLAPASHPPPTASMSRPMRTRLSGRAHPTCVATRQVTVTRTRTRTRIRTRTRTRTRTRIVSRNQPEPEPEP